MNLSLMACNVKRKACLTRRSNHFRVFAEDAQGGVQFAVHDEGPGIAADVIPRIFDRFWQSKQSGNSSAGLGLYIAKGIVERHGGRVWVESEHGVGSTFYAFVPDEQIASPSSE